LSSGRFEFPTTRPRRLRKSVPVRGIISETSFEPRNLIMPIFVKEGVSEPEPVLSMPGQYRYPVERVVDLIADAMAMGVQSVILFGIPKRKDLEGSEAYNKNGIVQRVIRRIRESIGDRVVVFTDVCVCQYTDHGHCGIISVRENRRYIDNDKTLKLLEKIAVSHAEVGADFVAPSGMMDGMVKAIRRALDEADYEDVGIMSYAAKYASSFYGPFREAALSTPAFGDRRTHQMDPRNLREALREVALDISEGADIIMIKPALAYLDVIRLVREAFPVPIAAYNVSGEYAMVKAAAANEWLNERKVVFEILTSIKRAGANLILTYHALDVARWIREGFSPF
jgi:porphobilinogen synthase